MPRLDLTVGERLIARALRVHPNLHLCRASSGNRAAAQGRCRAGPSVPAPSEFRPREHHTGGTERYCLATT